MLRSSFLLFLCFVFSLNGNTPEEMTLLWKEALAEVPDYPEGTYQGKGIVIPAGGEYYLVNAYINLSLLRMSGCHLPVEIWYIGEGEYLPDLMEKIKKLGAKCCDITKKFDYPIKGFEVKPHAILASRFEEVLLLDADNLPLSNPGFLFNSKEYLESGALFWPDLNFQWVGDKIFDLVFEEDHPLWKVLELTPRRMRGQESGQVLINKKKCWKALHLCLHMNKNSHFYYKHIYGDKDTFFLSHLVTETPYHMMGHLPGIVFREPNAYQAGMGFLQRDFEGKPLFFHAVSQNWAERGNLQPICRYYILPEQKSDECAKEFPWKKMKLRPFMTHFGTIEVEGIRLLKRVRPHLPNF